MTSVASFRSLPPSSRSPSLCSTPSLPAIPDSESPPSSPSASLNAQDEALEPDDLARYNVRMLVDELCLSPSATDIVVSARLWAMWTWSTRDGERFYLRHPKTLSALKEMPSYSRAEVVFLVEDRAKLCANRCMDYGYFKRKVIAISVSNISNEEKFARLEKLVHVDPLVQWWNKIGVRDRLGRIERFAWPGPESKGQHLTLLATRDIFLESSPPNAALYHTFILEWPCEQEGQGLNHSDD